MADWFKFYENDIDEMRLQWAIGEAAEVLPVWVALLSEACRHKDGTLSGYCEDFELFALAKRINISVPKVNQSIVLLVKIKYLQRMDDKTLFIRKWDEKQSEYCQRKTRLQNQTGPDHHTKRTKKTDIVPTVSEHSPDSVRQEERRGEENRNTEEAQEPKKTRKLQFQKPTKEQADVYSKEISLPTSDVQAFLDYHEARGWILSGGNKMADWKAAMRTWKSNGVKFGVISKTSENKDYSVGTGCFSPNYGKQEDVK